MKRYQVSKYFMLTLIIFLSSLMFLAFYLLEIIRFHFPVEVNAFNVGILRNNQYVVIHTQECVTHENNTKLGYTNRVSETLSISKDYCDYVLILGRNANLKVGLTDKQIIDEIDAWPYGKGNNPVTIIGRVTTDANSGTPYVIQVTKKEVKTRYSILSCLGGIGIILGFLLFFSVGGIRKVYVMPLEDTKRYKDYLLGRSYRMELDLEREKKLLEEYRGKQEEMRKQFLIGVVLSIASLIGFLVFGYFWLMGVTVFITITGIYLVIFFGYAHVFCITFTWKSFLNTDYSLAYKISDLFLLKTYGKKREESSKYIAVITKRLEQEKEERGSLREDTEGEPLMWYGPGVWELPKGESENHEDGGNAS